MDSYFSIFILNYFYSYL